MLASELIKTYEEFCPQELSMEGDVVGLQIGSLLNTLQFSVQLRIWCLRLTEIFCSTWLSMILQSM